MEVKAGEIVLCKFYFSDLKSYKNRPVLVYKDNLPFNDFLAIAISSKIEHLYEDEFIIENMMLEEGALPRSSKVMLRKTFIVEKSLLIKRYGALNEKAFQRLQSLFCSYHLCQRSAY